MRRTQFQAAIAAALLLHFAVFICANGSEVEHRLAKARAAGSNPVSRLLISRVPEMGTHF